MKIVMLAYPGMTLLDLVGPLQVWTLWPGADIQLAWKSTDPIQTDSAASINPTHDFASAHEDPDILFAPGGLDGTYALLNDAEVIEFLQDRGSRTKWITSVCTGALVLGAAGLLKGYKSTTHWAAIDTLEAFGATPVRERWVIDRNRASGGGVTAGIDFGLALMAEIAGDDIARTVQLGLEYSPNPPFNSGSPDDATPETIEAVMHMFGGADPTEAIQSASARVLAN
jgi:putative intracellular protease/amidase